MFWKKNKEPKCPITPDDKEWIENNLDWINQRLIDIAEYPTILPTKVFFDRKFTGTEDDAYYTLARIGELCNLNVDHIQLDFMHDQIDFGNGIMTAVDKDSRGVGGLYFGDEDGEAIVISREQLRNPVALIAVMAHELSHHLLIGKHDVGYSDENENEFLTDLTAIAYGFGVFLSNNSIVYNTGWRGASGSSGWSIGKQGYLPPQVIAYAMAVIQYFKGEIQNDPPWMEYLDKTTRKYLIQSLEYVRIHPPSPTGRMNW
jgi:hypothetical protein